GKSVRARMLRRLIDPNTAPLRSLARDERDFWVTASNCHLVALDNLSKLPDWYSDCLCRVATGGGFVTRTLNTDRELTVFDICRPILINGIGNFLGRPDFVDRSIVLPVPRLANASREAEEGLFARFEAAAPH